MIAFAGALPPETGVAFMTRLEREADRLKRAAKEAGGKIETWGAYAADAFAQMISGEGTGGRWQTELTIVCDLRAWRRGHAHEGENATSSTVGLSRSTSPSSSARTLS